ncbi:traf2 and NCK-interacting protein kinase-like [Xenopus laevis]|uniref:Traf2 and NCK-interacting protein kinase-like n=1 Tax=Xenopus laevis TaxID=8355 RepID=A0A8J1M6E5_XENLA|nr:traf2 and NCK-interacting protein kinase-like [Xenopus laevis]
MCSCQEMHPGIICTNTARKAQGRGSGKRGLRKEEQVIEHEGENSINSPQPPTQSINFLHCQEEQVIEHEGENSINSPNHQPNPSTSSTVRRKTKLRLSKILPKTEKHLKIGRVIGEGPFCRVHLGWHIDLQKEVAIKIINDPENEKYQEEELEILRKVTGHRNVIKFYGAFYHRAPRRSTPNKGLSISMELCTGGTIRDLMSGRKNNSLGEKWTAYICKEVIKGLCHLETVEVIHHDIKPINLMLTSSGNVKIGDFSCATMGRKSSSTEGTLTYMAPEALACMRKKNLDYDHKADIWSLGVSALEMVEGYLPYGQLSKHQLMNQILFGPALRPTWDKWSEEFNFFIQECVQKNPAKRPSARQLLHHPFISNLCDEAAVKRSIAKQLQRGWKN